MKNQTNINHLVKKNNIPGNLQTKNDKNIKNKINKPLETLEQVPLNSIQDHKNIPNIKEFNVRIKSDPETTQEIRILLDTGATFTSICPSAIEKLNKYNEIIVYDSRPFKVSTGNGEITYPGKYIHLHIQKINKPTRYITIRAYVTPHELIHKFIMGQNDQKRFGYIIAIKSGDKVYFHNKGITTVYKEIKQLYDDNNVGYDVENKNLQNIYMQDFRNKQISDVCTNFFYQDKQPEHDLIKETIKEQMLNNLPDDQKETLIKEDIHQISFNPKTPENIQNEIREIIKDIYKRKGFYIANRLKTILINYADRIGKEKFDIGKVSNVKFSIKLKPDAKPYSHRPITLNPRAQAECDKTISLLLKHNIIQEIEHTDWATPVFMVTNNDKTSRMVTNYKKLNEASIDDLYPTPNTQEMLQKFNGKTIFSKFDIIKAFFNIEVDEETKPLLSIVTKNGIYTWNRMPFGHKNCPAVWARASDQAFVNTKDLIKYVDDLVLASSTNKLNTEVEEHFLAIEEFFQRLRRNNLKINLSKCKFFEDEITFLGNTVNKNGIKPNDEYIKKILQFRPPTKIKELRTYTGCLEWISKYVYNLKELLIPLRPLLKQKRNFVWSETHQKAFEEIQQIIQHTEILSHPNFTKEFYIHTDSSDYSFGAILLQTDDENPDHFVIIDMFSKFWPETQATLHITSKELLAVLHAINKWKTFLSTKLFYISTDSNNIPYLFRMHEDKLINNPKHVRWIQMLSQYNFEVKYIKGIENKVADFLSRINKADLQRFHSETQYIQNIQPVTTDIQQSTSCMTSYNNNNTILTDFNNICRNIQDIKEFKNIIPSSTLQQQYYNDFLQQFTNTSIDVQHSSIKSSIPVKRRRSRRLLKKSQKQLDDEELVEKIEEIISDHESSESSFPLQDIQRNHAILKEEIIADALLTSKTKVPAIFQKEKNQNKPRSRSVGTKYHKVYKDKRKRNFERLSEISENNVKER
jgi:hypothetical protein